MSLPQALKISIGGGSMRIPGFHRVDLDPARSPDYLMDIRHLDFPVSSVAVIYASHVVEHLRPDSYESGGHRWSYLISLFSRWRELLAEGGELLIAVPDAEVLSGLLLEHPDSIDAHKTILDSYMGGARNDFDVHYNAFTEPLLRHLLQEAGFGSVERFDSFVPDESSTHILGRHISLNLKATRGKESGKAFVPALQATREQGEMDELQMYKKAADDRLKVILVLQKTCEERLTVIQKLEARIKLLQKQASGAG